MNVLLVLSDELLLAGLFGFAVPGAEAAGEGVGLQTVQLVAE